MRSLQSKIRGGLGEVAGHFGHINIAIPMRYPCKSLQRLVELEVLEEVSLELQI